jgi:hypothetical protein
MVHQMEISSFRRRCGAVRQYDSFLATHSGATRHAPLLEVNRPHKFLLDFLQVMPSTLEWRETG